MTIVTKSYPSSNAGHQSLLGTIPNKTKTRASLCSRDPCFSFLVVGFLLLIPSLGLQQELLSLISLKN